MSDKNLIDACYKARDFADQTPRGFLPFIGVFGVADRLCEEHGELAANIAGYAYLDAIKEMTHGAITTDRDNYIVLPCEGR